MEVESVELLLLSLMGQLLLAVDVVLLISCCHLRKIKNSCVRSVVDSKYVPGSLRETTQNYQVRCDKIGMERSVIRDWDSLEVRN